MQDRAEWCKRRPHGSRNSILDDVEMWKVSFDEAEESASGLSLT